MCDLTPDELWILEYYNSSQKERNKMMLKSIMDFKTPIDSLIRKKFLRKENRTFALTYKGKEAFARKTGRMPKHEVPMPWMIESTIMDIAVAIKKVDDTVSNSPAFDFERVATIATAVDKCSQNVFVKTLVQSWYSSDPKAAIAWAHRVHKE